MRNHDEYAGLIRAHRFLAQQAKRIADRPATWFGYRRKMAQLDALNELSNTIFDEIQVIFGEKMKQIVQKDKP